jgi:hypothetical protein
MTPTLLATWLDILSAWRPHFPQQRTYRRAVRQALGSLVCLGRRCLSRIIWAHGGQQRRWSSEYFLHARCRGSPRRLLVVAPTPYRKRKSSKLYYRQPAYLLTTDLRSSAKQLLQIYFDRWQIEVNHRDEKDTRGVGQAQLWNVHAVPKQPSMVVAAYSALLLAALETFGAQRGAAYAALPQWRCKAHRPSCLDLVTLLRKESVEHPELTQHLHFHPADRALTQAAAA